MMRATSFPLAALAVVAGAAAESTDHPARPGRGAPSRPNILCITCEAISPMLASFGDPLARTPFLDALARDRRALRPDVRRLRRLRAEPRGARHRHVPDGDRRRQHADLFRPPLTAWDESGRTAHWRNRPAGAPFFAVFNLEVTHESQVWARANEPLTVDTARVVLPPYYPDTPVVRRDVRFVVP